MHIDKLKTKTVEQLKKLCKEYNIKKYSKLRKNELIDILVKTLSYNRNIVDDMYTKNILLKRLDIFSKYHKDMMQTALECNINFRSPSIPEDISENIIKFILRKTCDKTSKWNRKKDLISEIDGIQECKCFTSDGPISFSPKSEWDKIFFLDARNWLEKKIKLYEFPHKRNSDKWKNIKVNKNETFQQHSEQKRRPRICWNLLYNQIKDDCILLFNGSIEDILI